MAGKHGWRRAALAVMAVAAAAPLALPASSAWAAGEAEGEQQAGAAAAAGIAVDESDRLPALKTNEVTGDFLGLGYDQRAVLEEASSDPARPSVYLRIYDGKGSKLRETALSIGGWPPAPEAPMGIPYDRGYDWWLNHGWAITAGLIGVKISAGEDGSLYVAGSSGDSHQSQIIKVDPRPEGMKQITSAFLPQTQLSNSSASPVVTSIDVGAVNGVETLAVGQSLGGVRLYNTHDLGYQGTLFEDWKRHNYMSWGRDLVTAVKFSKKAAVRTAEGTQVTGLAVGRLAYHSPSDGYHRTHSLYMVDPAAKKTLWQDVDSTDWGSGEIKAPTALAFDDENRRLAVSWWHEKHADKENPRRELLQVRNQDSGEPVQTSAEPMAAASRLTYVRTGTASKPHLVVGAQNSSDNQVLAPRVSGHLEPLTLRATDITDDKDRTRLTDASMRQWFPGYKSLKLSLVNTTGRALEARLKSGDAGDRGCWSNVQVGDRPAFPAAGFTPVPADGKPAEFASALLTAGPDGGCDTESRRYAYVELQPAGEPGLRTIVKLQQKGSELSLPGETAGNGALNVTSGSKAGAGLGEFELKVAPAAGQPLAERAPKIAATRLTTSSFDGDGSQRPVFRFDVSDAAWKVPGADKGLSEARIPAMTAQGTVNGLVWEDLGKLKPAAAPSLSGDVLTLGKSSFYWENTKDARQYTKIRVTADGKASQPVTLADLPAPDKTRANVSITLSKYSSAGMRANGLDQQPMEVVLRDSGGNIDKSAPEYNRIYYRDDFHSLITGLMDPSRPEQHTAVSTEPGLYSNDGGSFPSRFRSYLTTTSTQTKNILAHLEGASASGNLSVTGSGVKPAVNTQNGITVTNCVADCRLAEPSPQVPVLFQPRGGSASDIGILFKSRAITGSGALPLRAPDVLGRGEKLESADITISSGTRAQIPAAMPAAHGTLVTHGDYVELQDVPAQ
ncbi:hypothetical protein [Streptomyces sp. NPDC096030]|uniref:hypothetical protein n=1 Tax=Streptomyces sp. NPDC096030 TaxID=3155423 RepID=UPI0033308600